MNFTYTADDVIRLAKRSNNKKRSYLLVNPLQGKHMPVAPSRALDMMSALGQKILQQHKKARLVIGFAETATAIGAIAAKSLGEKCAYVQTTREKPTGVRRWIEFLEEHSHAPKQRIAVDALEEYLGATDTVVFVDDELSTGRTLGNILTQMKKELPLLREKKIVAASIINRLTPKDKERLQKQGVECVALVEILGKDYEAQAAGFSTRCPTDFSSHTCRHSCRMIAIGTYKTPRTGVLIGDYMKHWQRVGYSLAAKISWKKQESILILGTEECMLPGLLIGKVLEEQGFENIFFHATTRSPIGILEEQGYPIKAGWQVQSFYDDKRATYIYNLKRYHHVVIVSDSEQKQDAPPESLLHALIRSGCQDIIYLASCTT